MRVSGRVRCASVPERLAGQTDCLHRRRTVFLASRDPTLTGPRLALADRRGAAMATRFGGRTPSADVRAPRDRRPHLRIAAGIPDFGDVVSLIGGLANSLMGLILPRAAAAPPPLAHARRNTAPAPPP